MKHHPYRVLFALAAMAVFAACGGGGGHDAPAASAPAPTESAPVAQGSASITGSALYFGDDPDTEISMGADPNCQALHSSPVYTQTVEADAEGGLANAFVYVKSGLTGNYPAPSTAIELTQVGCTYSPHVFGVQVGQKVVITNGDATLHNVHATPEANAEFNMAQPFQDMKMERTFDQAEVMVPFKCDVHPWMSAYAGVVSNPFFAVTGADGSFSIEGLPAGTYTLEAWHEVGGTRTAEVTVEDGGSASASFDFSS